MATNIIPVHVYQINQRQPIPLAQVTQIGFPSAGVLFRDTFSSPTRALSTGVSVYSAIQDAAGNLYYTSKTLAQLVTLWNA